MSSRAPWGSQAQKPVCPPCLMNKTPASVACSEFRRAGRLLIGGGGTRQARQDEQEIDHPAHTLNSPATPPFRKLAEAEMKTCYCFDAYHRPLPDYNLSLHTLEVLVKPLISVWGLNPRGWEHKPGQNPAADSNPSGRDLNLAKTCSLPTEITDLVSEPDEAQVL